MMKLETRAFLASLQRQWRNPDMLRYVRGTGLLHFRLQMKDFVAFCLSAQPPLPSFTIHKESGRSLPALERRAPPLCQINKREYEKNTA
jgi:hypothetical protein